VLLAVERSGKKAVFVVAEVQGFSICPTCGAHLTSSKSEHQSPNDSDCKGTHKRFSFGHELVMDVVRLQFPGMSDKWDAYSIGYAVLLGAADI